MCQAVILFSLTEAALHEGADKPSEEFSDSQCDDQSFFG